MEPTRTPSAARLPRTNADYRWTVAKAAAFLDALALCGKVAEAARSVGMSGTSAYRLRLAMASARFDAAFEGARRSGIRARAAASRERQKTAAAAAARSPWAGPGLADLVARERRLAQGDASGAQGAALDGQGGGLGAQGAASDAQGDALGAQGGGLARKVTENTPGPCNTRSMSYIAAAAGIGGTGVSRRQRP